MDQQFVITVLVAVLSSSLLAAILSSAISVYQKKKDFENDFFREIVRRRLAVYQTIETIIASLKSAGLDDTDARPYHLVFAFGMDEFMLFHQNVRLAIAQNLWISDEANVILSEFGQHLYKFALEDDSDEALLELAKQRYIEIGRLRDQLEEAFKKDFVSDRRAHV